MRRINLLTSLSRARTPQVKSARSPGTCARLMVDVAIRREKANPGISSTTNPATERMELSGPRC